jgi:acyl-CoA synthetase (AMP-forming)/AMP-acid ligase II
MWAAQPSSSETFDPVQTFNLLVNEKITLFFGVPAVFLALIQHPDFKADIFKKGSPGDERGGAAAQ